MVETVPPFLIAPLPVFFRHFLRVQYAAKRIVPAAGIGNNACQYAAHIGVKTVPGGEPRRMLTFQRIGEVQTLAFVVRVKHQQADVCPAVDIRHAQDLPAFEDKRKVPAARQDLFTQECFGLHMINPLRHKRCREPYRSAQRAAFR